MSDYRVVCVNRLTTSPAHRHITDVGTGTDRGWNRRWSAPEVRNAIKDGDTFYALNPNTESMGHIEAYDCTCGLKTLRSVLDDVADSTLDTLPEWPRQVSNHAQAEHWTRSS